MNKLATLLLVDDEPDKILIFQTILEHHGFCVLTDVGTNHLMEKIFYHRPDLILLDINIPGINGHEIRQQLKASPSTRHLPVVMFSSSDALEDKLQSLRSGADDYITKNMDHRELVARIEALIRRYRESAGINPLTRLPGNHAIEEDMILRIRAGKAFSVGYADLDNFKAYNDVYGFKKGDEAIRRTADTLTNVIRRIGSAEDFVGHIGGDDFVFVLDGYDRCDSICRALLEAFNQLFPQFYNETDRARGYIETKNRKNETELFPLMSVSIAVITNKHRVLTNVGEIAQLASEVKKIVKARPGNQYYIDQRGSHEPC